MRHCASAIRLGLLNSRTACPSFPLAQTVESEGRGGEIPSIRQCGVKRRSMCTARVVRLSVPCAPLTCSTLGQTRTRQKTPSPPVPMLHKLMTGVGGGRSSPLAGAPHTLLGSSSQQGKRDRRERGPCNGPTKSSVINCGVQRLAHGLWYKRQLW